MVAHLALKSAIYGVLSTEKDLAESVGQKVKKAEKEIAIFELRKVLFPEKHLRELPGASSSAFAPPITIIFFYFFISLEPGLSTSTHITSDYYQTCAMKEPIKQSTEKYSFGPQNTGTQYAYVMVRTLDFFAG